MPPPNISAKLLDAMGVGLCLVDAPSLTILFRNPAFAALYPAAEPGVPVAAAVEALPPETLLAAVDGPALELRARPKRRELILETRVRRAMHDDRPILVLECQNVSRLKETEAMIDSYVALTERRNRELEREKVQVEKLLLNIMPRTVYDEYKTFGSVAPRLFEPVSVIMLDFVGFTEMAASADPTTTVAELNDLFTAFDRIGEMHGCERIKTIGDCYMAVAGLPHANPEHTLSAARCASKMIRYLHRRNQTHPHRWRARIGLASGPVVGSVVGVQKYVYDVFGPAVNLAARLQALSDPMEITVCESAAADLSEEFALLRPRTSRMKGFGAVSVATLAPRPPAAAVA
ncbi:adenylate/guanylate cyclase domain-containing protein [Albimonas pacifica]|uniref:Adenylate cyclase, class 3 n=1 Tax=Albimonas pacifica TaxID=1114924 RepID=A0A1I3BZ62_9RHOB|nr:adenylate/guanylate cyclase domain-containing protein [Albimonas pacifica]SFH67021.1 Adenylate cyclase, class 3 [Albimonas pacifica]